jgi:hypothetical protein
MRVWRHWPERNGGDFSYDVVRKKGRRRGRPQSSQTWPDWGAIPPTRLLLWKFVNWWAKLVITIMMGMAWRTARPEDFCRHWNIFPSFCVRAYMNMNTPYAYQTLANWIVTHDLEPSKSYLCSLTQLIECELTQCQERSDHELVLPTVSQTLSPRGALRR